MVTKRDYQRVIIALETGLEVTHSEADIDTEKIVVETLMKVGVPYSDKAALLHAYFTEEIMLNSVAEYVISIENKSVKIEENA